MSSRFVVWKYQFILLKRNKFLVAGLLFLFIAGLYGARYGKHFVTEQNKVIYSVDTLQQRNKELAIKSLQEKDSAAIAMNRSFPGWEYYQSAVTGSKTVVYRPSAFATFSIGQKDNYPYYHEITSSWYPADFYSVTSTDIQNPVKLLAGNFDLAFVIIYLLPLVIIAIGYNALSGEKESNTFTLLRVQGSVAGILRHKLAFQATLLIVVCLLMNICACWVNGIDFAANTAQIGAWLTVTSVYIIFWFSIVYIIATLRLASSTNALLLGGLWVLLLLVLPSAVHKIVSNSQKKELVQSMFNNRGDFPDARDLSQEQLEDSFNRLEHPYKFYPMTDTGQAAHHFYRGLMANEIQIRNNNARGRQVLQSQANEYKNTIALNWINPVFAVQNAFNQVAGTEINNYHHYLITAEKYQTQRRYYLYGYSMQKKEFKMGDYQQLPEFNYSQPVIDWRASIQLLLPVILLTLVFIAVAAFNKVDQLR